MLCKMDSVKPTPGQFEDETFVEPSLFAGILLIVIVGFGIIGNFLIIFIFLRARSLHHPGNILVINLAIADLVFVVSFTPSIYHQLATGGRSSYSSRNGCIAQAVMSLLAGGSSIISVGLLAGFRFVNILLKQT